jgi:hypothetical protein
MDVNIRIDELEARIEGLTNDIYELDDLIMSIIESSLNQLTKRKRIHEQTKTIH